MRLYELHGLVPTHRGIADGILIVLNVDGRILCIFVDEILYQIQTIIKNLSVYFGAIRRISGCNILGNGEVSLVLDVEILMRDYHVSGNGLAPQRLGRRSHNSCLRLYGQSCPFLFFCVATFD